MKFVDFNPWFSKGYTFSNLYTGGTTMKQVFVYTANKKGFISINVLRLRCVRTVSCDRRV